MATTIELQFYPANATDYRAHRTGLAERLRTLAQSRARAAMTYLQEDGCADPQPAIALMADVELLLDGAERVESGEPIEVGLTAEHVDLDRLQTQAIVLTTAIDAAVKRYSIDKYDEGALIELASGLFGGISALASQAKGVA